MTNTHLPQCEDLQGQCKIIQNSCQYLKFNSFKAYFIFPILSLLSCFIFPLVVRQNNKLKAWIMYDKSAYQEATHMLMAGNDQSYELVEIICNLKNRYFYYRKVKYIDEINLKEPFAYEIKNSLIFSEGQFINKGLKRQQYQEALKSHGYCEHLVEIPTLAEYLINELTGIFFIIMYLNLIQLFIERLYAYLITLLVMSVISTVINYYLFKKTYIKIKEIAEKQILVTVLRDSKQQIINSRGLVPGDLYKPQNIIPCDSILVRGNVYMDQSSLTGENHPIGKNQILDSNDIYNKNNWLFEGGKVLETRNNALALVVRTGFITRKGKIIRKILFKDKEQPHFFKNALYFLLELTLVVAVVQVALMQVMLTSGMPYHKIILRFLDMLSWLFPPPLAIVFNFCYTCSLYRLSNQKIFGTEPYKTITSTKISTVCFDKTGTITENSMVLHSVIPILNGVIQKEQFMLIDNSNIRDETQIINKLFACCHNVIKIGEEYRGDQLDLRMFEYSKYQYVRSENKHIISCFVKNNRKLEVLRINQFQSKYQSMSVIARDVVSKKYYLFFKGAPEKIISKSNQKIEGFDKLIFNKSLSGLRCLAYGYKQLEDINKAMDMARSTLEKDISVIGFVTFENRIKEDALQMVNKLKQAQIEMKLITGDNVYIAIETALRCKLLESSKNIVIFQGNKQINQKQLHGELMLRDQNGISCKPLQISLEEYYDQNSEYNYAVDNTFIQRHSRISENIKIFARISPEMKAKIVLKLRKINSDRWQSQQKIKKFAGKEIQGIGMVGDGANDIMAIKQADIGIGISQTDSSYAADFTISRLMDVEAIMRQGRNTAVIIGDIFRYYSSMSILKLISSNLLIVDKSDFYDGQLTFFMYGIAAWITFFLALSRPTDKLSKYIPTQNPLSLESQLLFYGFLIINTLGLITGVIILSYSSEFTQNPEPWIKFTGKTNTVVFIMTSYMLLTNSICIYRSSYWKSQIWQNRSLTVFISVLFSGCILIHALSQQFSSILNLVQLSAGLRIKIGAIVMGFAIIAYLWKILVQQFQLYKK